MVELSTSHDWDVVVVGAGPVGGHTANLLSKRGQRVLLLEEHNEIGRPFQCAGLVTPNAMKQVNLYDTILEEVDGALIHGPSGTLVPVGTSGKVRTYVVCRKLFDEAVVKQSMVSGATLWLNSKPISAETQQDRVSLTIIKDGKEIFSPAISITPVDTNGAGDMYAGSFMHAFLNGFNLSECADFSNYASSKVVETFGPRLTPDGYKQVSNKLRKS